MKKITILIPMLLLFLYSCKDKENLLELSIPQNDPESKIADLERSGVKLFKRNMKLLDVSGENLVIVQVASEDESTLNNYFKGTKFSLTLGEVFKQINTSQSPLLTTKKLSSDKVDIYNVVLFKKIDSKYKSYTLSYERQGLKNARIKGVNDWAYDEWHDSALFDDWMRVDWYTVNNADEGVNVAWEYKRCGFCSWQTDGSVGLHAGNTYGIYNRDARRIGGTVRACFGI